MRHFNINFEWTYDTFEFYWELFKILNFIIWNQFIDRKSDWFTSRSFNMAHMDTWQSRGTSGAVSILQIVQKILTVTVIGPWLRHTDSDRSLNLKTLGKADQTSFLTLSRYILVVKERQF